MAALLIPGLAFLSALVLVALANTANVHTKAQTEAQQTFWQFLGNALTGKTIVHQITQATRAVVSRFALAQLKPVTAWFLALNLLLRNVFASQASVAEETATAVERLRGHVIPTAVGKAVAPANAAAKQAGKTAHKALGQATTTTHAFNGYRTSTAPKITHATHAIDVAIPKQIGAINTEIDRLRTGQAKLRERTTSLENGAIRTFEWIKDHPLSLVTGVFAGAVAVALGRLGLGFLKCRSWKNVGNRITCGMGNWIGALLDLVATFALALLGVLHPEALAAVAVKAVDVIEPQLQTLLADSPSPAALEKDIERFASFLGIG